MNLFIAGGDKCLRPDNGARPEVFRIKRYVALGRRWLSQRLRSRWQSLHFPNGRSLIIHKTSLVGRSGSEL